MSPQPTTVGGFSVALTGWLSPSTRLLVVLMAASLAACGLESDGSHKTPRSTVAAVDREAPKLPVQAASGRDQPKPKKPPLDAMIEVVTKPEHDRALRIWTAGYMAGLYPSEAAGLLSTSLAADDPKVAVAIVEGLDLNAAVQVRGTLEQLREHEVPEVAEAVQKKLAP